MSTWLGRYSLGDWVPMTIRTRNSSGVVTAPTSTSDKAPIAAVFSASAKVANIKFSPTDRATVTGLFSHRLRLDSSYSAGQYLVAVTYTVSSGGFMGSEEFTFEVVGAGSASGAVHSMTEFLRPEATHLTYATDSGAIFDGRNPY